MQAIILAAGMGKRLKELTRHSAKCMVQVNGVSMVERMLRQLDGLGLRQIVLVVGFEKDGLKAFVESLGIATPVVYVENNIYYKTNNIYSLYLAKEYLLEDDTLLLESDLIFENCVLYQLVNAPYPNLALVAKFESWMDGTVVTLDEEHKIEKFLTRKDFRFEDIRNYYKTVNIYKFSRAFSEHHYVPFLEAYSKALGNNAYYEQVLKVISLLDVPDGIRAETLERGFWYEIDDEQDLDIAESIFTNSESRLSKLQTRYGGYWRYPHLTDFCYLVNPFFPNQRLLDEMKASFERLIFDYPSGQEINRLLIAKSMGIRREYVSVGNGACELIRVLMESLEGKVGVVRPNFEEYINCSQGGKTELIPFDSDRGNYRYTADDLMGYFKDACLRALLLVNPDNPTGNYIGMRDVIRLVKWCAERDILCMIDESFVDFADDENVSLLHNHLLEQFPGLIVIKSISKSYGVPGLRLGLLACSDSARVEGINRRLPIWNINSFGEYFLQIFEKYQEDYRDALKEFRRVRREFAGELQTIGQIRVYPSQANFLMCEIMDGCLATQLTEMLLNRYDLLIKDLSTKAAFKGRQFVRLAVKTPEENRRLTEALKNIFR